jgi:hypothetical protein
LGTGTSSAIAKKLKVLLIARAGGELPRGSCNGGDEPHFAVGSKRGGHRCSGGFAFTFFEGGNIDVAAGRAKKTTMISAKMATDMTIK